jgi:iron complex outermembrane receptor protein
MSKQQARDDRRGVAPNALNDSGEKEFKHLSLHYDYFFNNDVDLSLKTYWQNFDRERSVRFIGSPGVENRQEDQTSTGLIAKLNWKINPQWSFETGYDIEHQEVSEFRQRLTTIRRDAKYDFTAQGIYAKFENTPLDWLRWNMAYRVDRLSSDPKNRFVNNGTTLVTTLLDDQTIVQPKFNVFANLSAQQTLFANAGRSFQTPTGTDLNTRGGTVPVDVAINDGWEIGLKSAWHTDLNTRFSY